MSIDENVDWVTVRAGCSAVRVFEQLREQVRQDVEKRKEVGELPFLSFDKGAAECFSVTGGTVQRRDSVTFVLSGGHIVVTAPDQHIEASLTINNEGQCRLKIKGAELALWQVRKMALEKLFFEA